MSPPARPGVHDGERCVLVGAGGSPNVTMLCEMTPKCAGGQKSNVSERMWRANNSRPARPRTLNWICLPCNERLRGCVSKLNQINSFIRHFIKFPVLCGARCQTHFIGAVCGMIQSRFYCLYCYSSDIQRSKLLTSFSYVQPLTSNLFCLEKAAKSVKI